jgi:hypothetical protein
MAGREEVSSHRQGVFFRGKRHDQTRLMSIMLDTASPVGARVQLRLQAAVAVGSTCITWPDKGVARRHGRKSVVHRNARNSTAQGETGARNGNKLRAYRRGVCILVCLCYVLSCWWWRTTGRVESVEWSCGEAKGRCGVVAGS